MIIFKNNNIFIYSILIIFLIIINSSSGDINSNSQGSSSDNNNIDVNKILRDNFEIELYLEDVDEKYKISNQLIKEQPQYSNIFNQFSIKRQEIDNLESQISSGSGQNVWNGETCEDTTFDFPRNTTNCPNDCFSVWGQGLCNQDSGKCNCNYFYYGDDCSQNYDPDHNWDFMNCNGGRYCPPVYGVSVRSCLCPEGQQGLECSVCTSNQGCQALKNDTLDEYRCDTTSFTYFEKSYSCVVTSEEVNADLNNSTASASIDCQFPNATYDGNVGQCTMDLYYRIHGSPLYFNCTFSNCNRDILPGQNQSITCQNSVCNCTSYCGMFLNGLIEAVTGPAQFTCGPQSVANGAIDCFFSQNVISTMIPTIPLSCVAGECFKQSLPPPPVIYPVPVASMSFIYFYIGSGIGFVVFTLVVGAIFLIFTHQEDRKKFIEDTHLVCELSFKHISCKVKERKGVFGPSKIKTILDDVTGVCPPGQLTALMGLSGSGKTSLLDILSGRKNVGDLTGSVLINGAPVGKNFKRISGYVTQDDIMIGTLTCREHLMYAALLKLPEHFSLEYKRKRVSDVLEELGLTRVADYPIGTPEKRGISGGERRRLSIATELIVDPSILFLDEPTSGLDSHSASELITKLKQLASNSQTGQRTIVFSIHQPSAEIFEQFDNLILLHQGNPYFSGKADESVDYFIQQKLLTIPELERPNYRMHLKNPADFIISIVTDKICKRVYSNHQANQSTNIPYFNSNQYYNSGSNNYKNRFQSQHQQQLNQQQQINSINSAAEDNPSSAAGVGGDDCASEHEHLLASPKSHHHQHHNDVEEEATSSIVNHNGNGGEPLASHIKIGKVEEYATSFWTQFFVVCRRSLLNYMRNPFLLRTTYFVHIFVGLTLGYLFWKLPANLEPGCQNRFGAMFFMTALLSFGSLTSLDLFYNDRIIFIRERANGFYRTSAYFLAKVVTDIIPMRVLPPIILGSICYYMIGLRPGILHFIYFIISLVLTSTVASCMCMAISTISPTFGTANMVSILLLFVFLLFDGFLLARSSIPKYLIWLVWLSFMSYGLEIPVVNEFNGLWISYNPPNTSPTNADGLEFLTSIGADPSRLFTDMYVLLGMITGYLLLAYIFLRFLVREYR